jgi:heat shock protein HslJ
MGSSLAKTTCSLVLTAFVMSDAALAQGAAPNRTKRPVSESAEPQFVPAGTYRLMAINGRPVRDVALAKSQVTFATDGRVSVVTACNRIGGRVVAKRTAQHILGFSELISTQMGCIPDVMRAERDTMAIMQNTANIARAGATLTFFNARGDHIAQWSALNAPVSMPSFGQAPAPQDNTPTATTSSISPVIEGDYVLSELNGVSIGATPATAVAPPPGAPTRISQLTPRAPSPMRIVVAIPSLFLADNGNISGTTGCNRFNTSILTQRGIQAGLAPVATTKMTCLSPQTRALEGELLTAFRQTVRVDVSRNALEFHGQNGTRVARFSAIGARVSRLAEPQ